MVDYVKSTNFFVKDSLLVGNPDKIVKGSEIDTEFNNIATAVSSKANDASPNLTGLPTAPTAPQGTNTSQIATTAFVFANSVPIGAIILWSGSIASIPSGYSLCDGSNGTPNLRDRFIVGAGTAYAVGALGGSKDAIVVSHTHTFSGSGSTGSAGSHLHDFYTGYLTNFTNYGGVGNFGGGTPDDGAGTYRTSTAGDHSHSVSVSGTTASSGSSGTNANVQPYIVVKMWKRTA